jgi:hypothetical protein
MSNHIGLQRSSLRVAVRLRKAAREVIPAKAVFVPSRRGEDDSCRSYMTEENKNS